MMLMTSFAGDIKDLKKKKDEESGEDVESGSVNCLMNQTRVMLIERCLS